MGILTVIGGLSLATIAFFWAAVRLAQNYPDAIDDAASAYQTFLLVSLAYLLLPGLGSVVVGVGSWLVEVVA